MASRWVVPVVATADARVGCWGRVVFWGRWRPSEHPVGQGRDRSVEDFFSKWVGGKDPKSSRTALKKGAGYEQDPRGRHEPPRDLDLRRAEYIPLPPSPTRWEVEGRDEPVPTPQLPLFEVSEDSGWTLVGVRKLEGAERPDPAFRKILFVRDGVLLLDPGAKLGTASAGRAAMRRLDRYGNLLGERRLGHDVYRIGTGPSVNSCAILDSEGTLHLYDGKLAPLLETNLRNDPRVVDHYRFVESDYWGEFRSHIRAIDFSPERARYLFTIADEVWCCGLEGETDWGVRMPLNQGWQRAVGRTGRSGVAHEVEKALRLFGLSLPVRTIEVKQRYRALALEHHPDRNPGDRGAVHKMQEVTDAFGVLTGVDPDTLELDESDKTYFRRTSPDRIFSAGPFTIEVSGFSRRAQDWVYGASFAAGSCRVYLATYSGKVIQVSEQGDALRVYDLGTTPEEIVDTGRHLYFLTPTRLYVVEDGIRLQSARWPTSPSR